MSIGTRASSRAENLAGNLRANSYARAVSSSCSVIAVVLELFGIVIIEYASPVLLKVSASTAEILTPRANGKVLFCAEQLSLCSTTLLRSPCASVVPAKSVNFFCAPTARARAVSGRRRRV